MRSGDFDYERTREEDSIIYSVCLYGKMKGRVWI